MRSRITLNHFYIPGLIDKGLFSDMQQGDQVEAFVTEKVAAELTAH